MKNILALIFTLSACTQNAGSKSHKFVLNIWDSDYSMAFTTHYKVNNDSIIITTMSGIQNESNIIILNRKVNRKEEAALSDFLSSFPLDNLATEYNNPLVEDGDQKRIEIILDNKKKIIEVKNFYQKDIDDLFNAVNKILDKNLQIKYKK